MSETIKYDSPEQAMLKPCPFCGEEVNCFLVPDERFGCNSWVIECKNMGCILPRVGFNVDREMLFKDWNYRPTINPRGA